MASEVKVSELKDGGNYSCGMHNFIATNMKDWHEHIDAHHTMSGSGRCVICGRANIGIAHVASGAKPVCDVCRKELAKQE